jgi:hypothetical protein
MDSTRRATISDLVNDAVRQALAEDADDLGAIEARKKEPTRSFEAFLGSLVVARIQARWPTIRARRGARS